MSPFYNFFLLFHYSPDKITFKKSKHKKSLNNFHKIIGGSSSSQNLSRSAIGHSSKMFIRLITTFYSKFLIKFYNKSTTLYFQHISLYGVMLQTNKTNYIHILILYYMYVVLPTIFCLCIILIKQC